MAKFEHTSLISFLMAYTDKEGKTSFISFRTGGNIPFKKMASLTTEDKDLIAYIRGRKDFGSAIVEVGQAQVAKAIEPKQEAEDNVFTEVKNTLMAKEILNKQFNIPHSRLGNKTAILDEAQKLGVKFPNIPE